MNRRSNVTDVLPLKEMDMRDISTEAIDRAAEIVPEQIRAGLHDRRVRRNLSDATGSALRLGRSRLSTTSRPWRVNHSPR